MIKNERVISQVVAEISVVEIGIDRIAVQEIEGLSSSPWFGRMANFSM